MPLGWTLYFPDMRQAPQFEDLYQEKKFRVLRVMGVKFWDPRNHKWCMFPDSFREDRFKAGVLQDWVPPAKRLPEKPPEQQSLF